MIAEGVDRIDEAYDAMPTLRRSPVFALVSGGSDSTAAALVAERHPRFAGVVHIDTGTGLAETREYVEELARSRGWWLRTYETPPSVYEELVLEHGFPGPADHGLMFRRLKERRLRDLTRDLKAELELPRTAHIALVSGARAEESARRKRTVEPFNRVDARVFVAALHDRSKLEVLDLLEAAGVEPSIAAVTIHKSGECLCGAFAEPGELDELGVFFPAAAARIRSLEELVREHGRTPRARAACRWGRRPPVQAESLFDPDAYTPGPLCSSCPVPTS